MRQYNYLLIAAYAHGESDTSDLAKSVAETIWAERVSGLKSGIKSDAAAIWSKAFETEWDRNTYPAPEVWLAGFKAENRSRCKLILDLPVLLGCPNIKTHFGVSNPLSDPKASCVLKTT